MKTIIITIVILLMSISSILCQSNKAKSAALYYSAEAKFETSKFYDALVLLKKSVKVNGGKSNARIEALRAKCYSKQKKWKEAKKALEMCYKLKPDASILKDISLYVADVEQEYDDLIKRERAELKRKQKEKAERELAEYRRKVEKKKAEDKRAKIINRLLPEISSKHKKFKELEEGRPYLITNRKHLTKSNEEVSIFVFYDSRYIIYTIPNIEYVRKLFKDKIRLSGDDAAKSKYRLIKFKHRKLKNELNFYHEPIHCFGGNGDELVYFEKTKNKSLSMWLSYYFQFDKLRVKKFTDKYKTFYKLFYNEFGLPFIETGSIEKLFDYDLLDDLSLLKGRIRDDNFKFKKSETIENPQSLEIRIKPSDNIKILYPIKKIEYKNTGIVLSAKYGFKKKRKFKGSYFKPVSHKTHYAFTQFNVAYGDTDLLSAIRELKTEHVMTPEEFGAIYDVFSRDFGNEKGTYFKDTRYTLPFEVIPKLFAGYEREQLLLQSGYSSIKSDIIIAPAPDVMAQFPGGLEARKEFIKQHLSYKRSDLKSDVEKVKVTLQIKKDGSFFVTKIDTGNEKIREAVDRFLRLMPKWTPAKKDGNNIDTWVSMPIVLTKL